jgi:succinylarginine dihydrolase
MFHRSIEAPATERVLARIFADAAHFVVHPPLPGGVQFSDEGAANHTRLFTDEGAVELFAWGRQGFGESPTRRFPARQTREASLAVARRHGLRELGLLWQQDPAGIDAGSFHTDVLASGNGSFMMFHPQAFLQLPELLDELRARLGHTFSFVVAGEDELPVSDAIAAYPFNSQVLSRDDGSMTIVAPYESRENPKVRRFLDRVVDEANPVEAIDYIDVNASMNNGGGPACLRLRVPLSDAERAALGGRVIADESLLSELEAWVERHYRDRLTFADLGDAALLTEVETALDELSQILELGSVYEFQI